MYDRRASGITTEPSFCWPFSRMAMRVRPTARPLPFRVCRNRGFAPGSGRYRRLARRAWKSVQFEPTRYKIANGPIQRYANLR